LSCTTEERRKKQFEGYDTDDYEGLTMVRERAQNMDEDDLQFMGWLLGLGTDRSVYGVSKWVFVQPTKRWTSVSSTSSSVGERSFRTRSDAETLTIEDIRKKLLRLQKEEDEVMRLEGQNWRRNMKQMNDEISRNGSD
jgi:hypothetical protein